MDKLKDFIDTNREAFEDDLLPDGHFERFEKRLEKKRNRRRFSLAAVAMAAAVGLFLFLKIQSDLGDASQPEAVFTCEAGEEIEELRLYYNMQIYDVEAQIKELYAHEDTPGGLELMEETEQLLQTTCDFEANILPTLPCSDAGVFAMNQYYSNSLKSLNFMLKQMERVVNMNHN
ncbi:MAG: hypothetical protein LBQ73_05980 [Tannerellaceae bacterium]|jgi:hypothetical protein|nr:hypothetical protein [Tannerellaceae bacterium]